MIAPKNILNEFWGYTEFREPQENIINCVLKQNDVIALLPTGGGKSICFQVPALIKDGVCLVISPLISFSAKNSSLTLAIEAACAWILALFFPAIN